MQQTLKVARSESRSDAARLVQSYGGALSTALLDPTCSTFRHGGIDGAIVYRQRLACAVSIGDPVCALPDVPELATAFRDHCRERGWHTAYAAASDRFARWAVPEDFAALAFGEELLLDPRRDPAAGSAGRELRKKLSRAKREGVVVREYTPFALGRNGALEAAMSSVVDAWLAERRGPQMYVRPIELFGEMEGRRWFYAREHGRVTGVLVTVQLDAIRGHLLDHHVVAPDAAIGTSESLVAVALRTFGAEGCPCVTFGTAPARTLGAIHGLGRISTKIARTVYDGASRLVHLDARSRYRKKFQVARSEPSYLLVSPRRVGLREAVGFMDAFHLSFA